MQPTNSNTFSFKSTILDTPQSSRESSPRSPSRNMQGVPAFAHTGMQASAFQSEQVSPMSLFAASNRERVLRQEMYASLMSSAAHVGGYASDSTHPNICSGKDFQFRAEKPASLLLPQMDTARHVDSQPGAEDCRSTSMCSNDRLLGKRKHREGSEEQALFDGKGFATDRNAYHSPEEPPYERREEMSGMKEVKTLPKALHDPELHQRDFPQGVFYRAMSNDGYYCAAWVKNGKPESKNFAVSKHGDERAFKLACAYRAARENEEGVTRKLRVRDPDAAKRECPMNVRYREQSGCGYWVSTWYDEYGNRKQTSFGVSKYPTPGEAFEAACARATVRKAPTKT